MTTLPVDCDVLVVGAGPAGSACAQALARGGQRVLLVDQQTFPRDKVCGDGLIPDAHAALARLGVAEEVAARARAVSHVACIGPRGGRVAVPGRLAVLPRRELDDILCRAAVRAGARFEAPWRFEGLLQDGDRCIGARLRGPGGPQAVACRWLVLATGAVPQALLAAGLCERRTPSGMALRGHVRHPALAQRLGTMEVVWHRALAPGYGWIFPGPDGLFNIGVGLTDSHAADAAGHGHKRKFNLHQIFETFCRVHPTARELMAGGERVGELKGAPLRFSLAGARWSAPGVLVTGEAAGSTYSLTGEGIGKAMETGLLAAEALLAHGQDDAAARRAYDASLAALRPKFALYEKANRINAHPWLADLLIWRARRHPGLVRRMSGVLDETYAPTNLVSPRKLLRLLLPID
jgi:menaquinone-9 beta-reductase